MSNHVATKRIIVSNVTCTLYAPFVSGPKFVNLESISNWNRFLQINRDGLSAP
jgi:hypothetical protein